ncbi:MAG: iron-containing alcohol dehydrogenase [Hyphomicrobiales bacterium]|nr:iron-containing alcohol dehydrogenase [Hyphomicrobiales bacterium]
MQKHTYYTPRTGGETVFGVNASTLKFGAGCLDELGGDALALGLKRVGFFVDPRVRATDPGARAIESLRQAGIDTAVYDHCKVEPTNHSFMEAIDFARDGNFDGFISLGGGSVMDTAKAANLYTTHPAGFLDYVNAPIGGGVPIPGPVKPHIACPTTSGTGSEMTGAAIFDLVEQQVKTGISNKFLKPTLAVVDPSTTYSLPGGVVASTGFDVFTHAIESYTARPFTSYDRPDSPKTRPVYQGANPWSDIGAMQAIRLGGKYIVRGVRSADDHEARDALMFASALAGLAFGNAGVHIPHAMSYSVAGLNHSFVATGYEDDNPMVPHGISVVLNAPAAFRFTAPVAPERHLEVAAALGADTSGVGEDAAGALLADTLIAMMKATGIPNGLADLGYGEGDIPALVKGAQQQQRLLVVSPRPVETADLEGLYRDALRYW